MTTINELYKNDDDVKNAFRQKIKDLFSVHEDDREKILKDINEFLGDGNEFKILPETLETFKKLENEEEIEAFVEGRVNNFLNRFGDVEVNAKHFSNYLSQKESPQNTSSRKDVEKEASSKAQENTQQNNGGEWKNRFERQMEALEKNNPSVHKIINNIPEGKREDFLNTLVKNGQISPEDIIYHEKVIEKPVERKKEEALDETNPANFNNPKKSHILNAARAIERMREEKRYQAELSAQKARQNIREGNIRRIESGVSRCFSRYSDTCIVQKHNIEDFDKECQRKINGFNDMSKDDQVSALKQRLATDPELKAAHDRVVRGYKQLHQYDETMVRHLESARDSGIDVTRDAEEYYKVKQKAIDPAKVETDEIKKARTMLDKMAERVKEAVMKLMNRFGFIKKPEQEINNSSSNISGPSNE